ncbi:hypothetical protein R1sor_010247 [Riccia sorocarpa]|uniref:O-fucosyltransferase family protein n=1 Tax=Riccia sorocarpa TaxID=122646 RepID=A0ABD3HZ08_9MARC
MDAHDHEPLEQHHHRGQQLRFKLGMKVATGISLSLFLLVAIWYTVPSALSPIGFYPQQLEDLIRNPDILEANEPLSAPPTPSESVAVNFTQQEFGQPDLKGDESTLGSLLSPVPSPASSSNLGDLPLLGPAVQGGVNTSEDRDFEVKGISQGPAQNLVNSSTLSLALSSVPSPSPSKPEESKDERYMFPMLSSFVGTGNQLMEYKSAAVIARILNRTLCLAPFFGGPQRHTGYLGSNHFGMQFEERYDWKELSRFVKVVNIHECTQKCNNGTLDRVWRLRASRSSDWSWWFRSIPWATVDFDRHFKKWSSPDDIRRAFGQLNEDPGAKCVGLGGAFPGLRWRGAMWAAAAYTVHTESIMNASNAFQARVLGTNPYISVHWRFEESFCRGHRLGLCFSRCRDGALVGGGLKSERYVELPLVTDHFTARAGFHGAGLTREDIAAAIFDKAAEERVQSVYLSTDGWLRDDESRATVAWVVEEIRKKGFNVSGLWNIQGLPNFSDGTYVEEKEIWRLFGLSQYRKVSNNMIALVEQEICIRSVVFLGSGQSTWSLSVFDARRSRRRRMEFEASVRSNHTTALGVPFTDREMDDAVIEHLFQDKHSAGPACNGLVGGVPETYDDEAPDGWLDFEACEKRIDLGGKCVRFSGATTR